MQPDVKGLSLHFSSTCFTCPFMSKDNFLTSPVLLNLLNSLGKSNKMLDKSCILSLFSNLFNKLNNTGSLMLDPVFLTVLLYMKLSCTVRVKV